MTKALLAVLIPTLISSAAMAQMRDPSVPAGSASSILSGTPSGTSPGTLAPRTVPPVTVTTPSSSQSSNCGTGDCGSSILAEPPRRVR